MEQEFKYHECLPCGGIYLCKQCTEGAMWACSTVNEDEDMNMCDSCLDDFAESYRNFVGEDDED